LNDKYNNSPEKFPDALQLLRYDRISQAYAIVHPNKLEGEAETPSIDCSKLLCASKDTSIHTL